MLKFLRKQIEEQESQLSFQATAQLRLDRLKSVPITPAVTSTVATSAEKPAAAPAPAPKAAAPAAAPKAVTPATAPAPKKP